MQLELLLHCRPVAYYNVIEKGVIDDIGVRRWLEGIKRSNYFLEYLWIALLHTRHYSVLLLYISPSYDLHSKQSACVDELCSRNRKKINDNSNDNHQQIIKEKSFSKGI